MRPRLEKRENYECRSLTNRKNGKLARRAHRGWDKRFRAMAKHGDDQLIDE